MASLSLERPRASRLTNSKGRRFVGRGPFKRYVGCFLIGFLALHFRERSGRYAPRSIYPFPSRGFYPPSRIDYQRPLGIAGTFFFRAVHSVVRSDFLFGAKEEGATLNKRDLTYHHPDIHHRLQNRFQRAASFAASDPRH